MASNRRNITALLVAVTATATATAGCTAGCTSESYRIETRIDSDGVIDRAICQPARGVPDAIAKHDGWKQTRAVGKPTRETAIRQMKPLDFDDGKLKEGNGPLEKWARTTSAAFVADLLDYDLQLGIARRRPSEKEIQVRLIVLLDRYGLKCADAHGGLLKTFPKNSGEQFVIPFARKLLKQHVRDHADKPLSEEAIEEILVWLEIVSPQQPADEDLDKPLEGDEATKKTPLEEAWQAVIKRRFKSEEAYEAHRDRLTTRIWGVYRIPYPVQIFGTTRHFDVSLKLPGEVVETNGTIRGGGEVGWRFDAGEAFPTGYPMSCRSLETREGAAALLSGVKLVDRRKVLLRLVGLIEADDDPLLAVLRSSAAKKSWSPLEAYRGGLDLKEQAQELRRLERLYRLLQLRLPGSGRAGT
jgi:hypothetical protein